MLSLQCAGLLFVLRLSVVEPHLASTFAVGTKGDLRPSAHLPGALDSLPWRFAGTDKTTAGYPTHRAAR